MKTLFRSIRTNPLLFASIIGVIAIPLIYGGLYLWAFWDPYTGMKNAKVAVVNLDVGTEKDGETYRFGKEIVDKLKDDHNLSWQIVTQNQAKKGLENNSYYATLTIPSDFSSCLMSVDSDTPTQARFDLTIRDTNSYFVSKFSKTAANELARKLRKEVEKKYFDNMFITIRDIGTGLKDGTEGAWKLADGLADATDGSKSLFDGLLKAKDGMNTLKDGISKLFDGSKTLRDGIHTAHDGSKVLLDGVTKASSGAHDIATGSAALASGSTQLSLGSNQIASNSAQIMNGITLSRDSLSSLNNQYATFDTGMAQLQTGFSPLPSSLQKASSDLAIYMGENPSATSSATFLEAVGIINTLNASAPTLSSTITSLTTSSNQIKTAIGQISSGSSTLASQYALFNTGISQMNQNMSLLSTNARMLANGASQVDIGLVTLKAGTTTLRDGIAKLDDGSNELSNKLGAAADGSSTLSAGMVDAADGSKELYDGLVEANDGSHELATKLTDSADEIIEKTEEKKNERQATIMSDPLEVKETHIAEVPNNGTAFAPYFIPLSLWVGAMSIFFVLKLPPNRKYKKIRSWFISLKTYGISLCIGVAQAIILPYVMTNGLGLKALNYKRLYIYCIILSLLFVSLQYFLLRILSNVGRFIGIILLMLQLTSSSGTYPVETSHPFFQAISTFLPMTYAVKVLREIITGGNFPVIIPSWNVTISMMVGSIIVCMMYSFAFPRIRKVIGMFSSV